MTHTTTASEDITPIIKRKNQKGFDAFPEHWKDLIKHCEDQQTKLKAAKALDMDWTDAEFVKRTALPATTWNLLKSGNHALPTTQRSIKAVAEKLESVKARCAEIERELADQAKRLARLDVTGRFVETEDYKALKDAITNAGAKVTARSEERLIVYVAPTRGGKTWMKQKLVEEKLVNWEISGLPSWRRSYTAILLAFADMFGVSAVKRGTAHIIETLVLKKARTMSGVVWLEEVQAICQEGQEFVKNLLNQTTLTIIISLTPRAHQDITELAGDEESQLLSRCEATLKAALVSPAFITAVAPDLWKKRHQPAQLQAIADAANERGAMSLVREVCQTLAKTCKGDFIGDDKVSQAITLYRMAVPLINTRRALGRRMEGRKAA